MMHNDATHAPLSKPKRILEVGCGTGSMTRSFADKYASAHDVIGIDLSPVPNPGTDNKAIFLQGDFRTYAEDHVDSNLLEGPFDYIFSRMLIYGMLDWPGYINQAKQLLTSGGWLELQEIDMTGMFDNKQDLISSSWGWLQEQQAAWAERGLDMSCAPKLQGYLEDAGFVDVHAKEFRWMFGPRDGHPETDFIAKYSTTYLAGANFGAFKKVCGPSKTAAELRKVEQDIHESYSWSEKGNHLRFFCSVWS